MWITALQLTDKGFDALFATNHIAASDSAKAHTRSLQLAGLVGHRTYKTDIINIYVEACQMPVLYLRPLIEKFEYHE